MSGYKSAALRTQERGQVLLAVNAMGKPTDSKELVETSPILQGMSRIQVGHYLTNLAKAKEVRKIGKKVYAPIYGAQANNNVETKMFFVINVENQSIQLDVGGLRLPVRVE